MKNNLLERAPEIAASRTNADRIRAMSDEVLAKFLQEPFCDRRTGKECKEVFLSNCDACMLDWLQQTHAGGSQ